MEARYESMPTSPLNRVIPHLLADLRPVGEGLTDGELLARFGRSRDEDALAALVWRHASMVWGVCRRLLHHHDAEDAFQATFLVLVRKAADMPGQAVANWLYGVARQTAVRQRATAAKRGRREMQVVNMPEPSMVEVRDAIVQIVLDEELSRLPDHYRGVIVLCELEGMTRKEAARQLGIPEGSVASRLARARAMMAKRLAKRGVTRTGGALAAFLSLNVASAGVPALLVANTIKAASIFAAGQAAATGAISANVAALTEGVVKAMFVSKIKAVLSVVLILGFVATGATLTYTMAAGQDDKKPTVEKPVEPAPKQQKEKEAFTAWGKENNGLQAGLGFKAAMQDVLTPEEVLRRKTDVKTATVEFKVEHVTKSTPVKTDSGKDADWITGHGPDDLCLRPEYPKEKGQARFLSILTPNAIGQLNKAGIRDIEKHFIGKTVRVTGSVVIRDYRGRGTPSEVEIVVNDLSQLEVVK